MRDRSFFFRVHVGFTLFSKAHSLVRIHNSASIVDFPQRVGYMLTC
jgi:hypothetical protein